MKTKLISIVTLILILILILTIFTGCSNEKDDMNDAILAMVEVKIKIAPEKPQLNQDVTISALVTQGDDKVDDADEVLFEIWKDGQEDHEKIEGEYKGEGVYSISKSFKDSGVYYVISHTTARDMHTMPKKEFKVGNIGND